MSFQDIRKGYEDGLGKEIQEEQLSDEDKRLLDAPEDTLSTRAKLRLAYLRTKGGQSNE